MFNLDNFIYLYKAELLSLDKVYDGDTLKLVRVDKGFNDFCLRDIRLYGVNTPEIGIDGAQKAKDFVKDFFISQGMSFILKSYRDKDESFGRLLGIIFPLISGESSFPVKSLNLLLIEAGLAEWKYVKKSEIPDLFILRDFAHE